jgi:hypothetical protein
MKKEEFEIGRFSNVFVPMELSKKNLHSALCEWKNFFSNSQRGYPVGSKFLKNMEK